MTIRDLLRGLPVFDRPLPAFDTESVPGEPSALFLSWLRAAIDAGVSEPHAMTLSTVDAEGRPDARVLILKDLDDDGWQFATEDHAVYVLTPAEVQFWQGDHQRQHVRLRYRRTVNGWTTERLWP